MNRRAFLSTAAGACALPQVPIAAQSRVERLKITDVRVVPLKLVKTVGSIEPAWDPGGSMTFQVGGGSFVELRTDQGLVGIGPGMRPDLLPVVKAQLLGRDPFDVEALHKRLSYYASGAPYQGAAGVDIALWDLIGKACRQPLYKLWGGGRDRVTAYASMIVLSTVDERVRMATELKAQGWKAIKLRAHYATLREDVRLVEAVRKAVGDDMDIMVDANQAQSAGDWQPGVRWDLRRALETARELQKLNCRWLEEPLPRYHFDQLAELNRQVEIPIAGGENNAGVHEFLWILRQGVFDIVQPECMVLGGVTDVRKIGALAESFAAQIVPHHGGGDLGTVAHLHLVASWSNAPWLELLNDPPVGSYRHKFAIMRNPPLVDESGTIGVPQLPGLGVEIDPSLIAG
jgi:L-alanine-DL-glutamate epimerase-like enolase superfamily enzyme